MIGGNYAVGIVVFAILTIINFVVVTKGAGRISEVSARFTLDALPGKQMAIDADLNAGLLTREEAKARREEVRDEADFYGSMDGASKFVRGDAIAGLLILVINLIGGVLIGVLQHDLSFGDAMQTYTAADDRRRPGRAAAGAAAVHRGGHAGHPRHRASRRWARRSAAQVFGQRRALVVAAALMGLIGIVPGMPNLPFLLFAGVLGYAAWRLKKHEEAGGRAGRAGIGRAPASSAVAELSWDEVRPVEPLGLEVGYRLIALVDKAQGGELLTRLKGVRRKLTQDLGFLIPAVHVRDNLELAAGQYRILRPRRAGGERRPASRPRCWRSTRAGCSGRWKASPARTRRSAWTPSGSCPASARMPNRWATPWSMPAPWSPPTCRTWCANAPPNCSATTKCSSCWRSVGKASPKLVEDLTPKLLPLSVVVRVLQSLLAESVPLRQMRQIVEALLEHGAHTQDPSVLTAAVRTALGRVHRAGTQRHGARAAGVHPGAGNWNAYCRTRSAARAPRWNPDSPSVCTRTSASAWPGRNSAASPRSCWSRAGSARRSRGWYATACRSSRCWPTARCRKTSGCGCWGRLADPCTPEMKTG